MNASEINLVATGSPQWPRWHIVSGGWGWDGTAFTLDPKKAMVYAHGSLAEKDCRLLRCGQYPELDKEENNDD